MNFDRWKLRGGVARPDAGAAAEAAEPIRSGESSAAGDAPASVPTPDASVFPLRPHFVPTESSVESTLFPLFPLFPGGKENPAREGGADSAAVTAVAGGREAPADGGVPTPARGGEDPLQGGVKATARGGEQGVQPERAAAAAAGGGSSPSARTARPRCLRCAHVRRPGVLSAGIRGFGCTARPDLPPLYGEGHPLRALPADQGATCTAWVRG